MTTVDLLAHLRGMGVRVRAEGASVRCSAPEGVLTPALQEEIARRKTEILSLLGEDGAGQTLERLRLAPRPREDKLPLSFAQQRLWFLDQLDPDTSAYTIAARRRYRGQLDLTALADAFTELVRRHESLRTTFPSADGEPVQRIADLGPVTCHIVDLEHKSAADRDALVEQIVRQEAERPFDLARGPLFRPTLLRLKPDEHELLVAVHHIVADGWSLGILASELGVLYEAFLAGRPSPLPELPIQYTDFALWQRQWLTGDVLEAQRHYWCQHLGGRPAPLQLPTDHPRSSRLTSAGASHDFVLPRPLAHGLRGLSRREGATLFMTLLAAFKVLLARYSGEEDIVVGTPVANRNYVELESVVGFFANTLVLRTDLGGDPTFRDLLARVRETCLGAYSHPDMPFEKLVEELQPERTLDQNPLFQVSFVSQSAATGGDLTFVTVASPFDLTLFAREANDGTLSATIEYKRDLFEWETIARLADHYRTLLEGIVADPACLVSALPLLGEAEAHRLLIEWNATATDYPRDRSVHGLFEDQVDATPDAVALVFEGAALTYRELDRRANRLAHHLCALGVGPECLVGVWMERSVDMIVALLGILKAGGTYAPFDLLAPPERLAFMLRDAKVDLLLTHERMLARTPAHGLRTICLNADGGDISAQPDTRLGGSVSADCLAYVMYTSGSTGEPKGVAVTHRSVVRLVKHTDYARFGPDEVFLQLAPLAFDASTFEIWGALLHGGRLAIVPPGVLSVEELGTVLARHGVTTLWLTAGLFYQVVDHRIGILSPLRQLLAGGDVLSPAHVRRVLAALPGCRLINGYGPTEGTTFTCCHTVMHATSRGQSVPIGRPIANTGVYVLDRHLHPVPVGVPGELYISGDGLARGYLNRPELTAEKFIPNPFVGADSRVRPGARLYKTGDLARYLPDGNLEFLGRVDHQVKIRGFRIELGEIEAVLGLHPGVQETVALAREDILGNKRLIVYLVPRKAPVPSIDELRRFLQAKLPDYMIPSAFVLLDALPLTPNGKVDRQALPAPDQTFPEIEKTFVAPRDTLESQLARIWEQVLGVQPIGVHDNFFERGGHSLLAVRLIAHIEKVVGTHLPVALLFQMPTIAQLSNMLRQEKWPDSWSSLIPIHPGGSKAPFFWMHGDSSNAFLPRYLGPDQPFYGLEHQSHDGQRARYTRVETIAQHYLTEIRTVQPRGPYFLGGYSFGSLVAFEAAQQLKSQGEAVSLLVLLDPRSLTSGKASSALMPRSLDRFTHIPLFRDNIRRHLRNLATLGPQEKLAYILVDVQRRIKASEMLNKVLCKGYLSLGYPLPPSLRGPYILAIYHKAAQDYVPQSYPGRVLLFKDAKRSNDSLLDWQKLIVGELEMHEVPCEHLDMTKEPYIQFWAETLQACLHKAQLRGIEGVSQV